MKRDPEAEGSEVDSDDSDSDDEEVLPSTNHTQQSLNFDADEEPRSEKEDHEDEEVYGAENDETEEVDEDDCDDNMDGIEDGCSAMDGDTDASDEEEDREELNSENEASDKVEDSDDKDRPKGSGGKVRKRKLSDYIGRQDDAADASLGALKRLAVAKKKAEASTDRIFSDEDFKRIRELKAKREARLALVRHGLSKGDTRSVTLKLPSSDELSMKRVDPSHLEAHIKMSKEKRLELAKARREDRGKYQARAVIKKIKTGGSSNKQKQRQKSMPLAAKHPEEN